MKPKRKKLSFEALAFKNAKHRADLRIESGSPEKLAEAFKDVEVLATLEHLFSLAEKYRKQNKMKKVSVILEAAALIDRTTGEETDIVLRMARFGKAEETTLEVFRHTPREIFESPITYTELVEE